MTDGQPGAAPDLASTIVAMVVLLVTVAVVRRRVGMPQTVAPGRIARILTASATFAIVATMMFGVFQLLTFGAVPRVLPAVAFAGLLLGAIALILFGLLDLILALLRPKREKRWLVAALALFPLVMLGSAIGTALILAPERVSLGWRLVGPATAALCAGMAWWSRLPQQDGAVAKLFE